MGGTVYLPAGTYSCPTPITLPDSVRVRGDGDVSWLKGQLVFASGDSVEQLKIGAAGRCAVTNAAGASGTTFSDCRFHGGGSTVGVNSSVVYLGGNQGNVSDVLFLRCQIERTSYVPPAGVDAYAKGVGNTITIHEFCYLPTQRPRRAHHLSRLRPGRFQRPRQRRAAHDDGGLHLGQPHGARLPRLEGSHLRRLHRRGQRHHRPRLRRQARAGHGRHSSSGVLITGCTFLGAAKKRPRTGLPIVYECPTGIVIRDNTFYASPHEAIGGSHVGQGVTDAPGLLVEGNTFDMTQSPVGLTHRDGRTLHQPGRLRQPGRRQHVHLRYRPRRGDRGRRVPAVGNIIQGNTFTDQRSSAGEPTIELIDKQGLGCHDNHIIGQHHHQPRRRHGRRHRPDERRHQLRPGQHHLRRQRRAVRGAVGTARSLGEPDPLSRSLRGLGSTCRAASPNVTYSDWP